MRSSRVLSGILLVLVFCAVALAQDTGSITGTVTDQSGAAVAGAQVAVSSADHGIQRATTTNASGDYNESGLPGGTYDVVVTAAGFKKFQARAVKLDVAQKARVDVSLQVGAATTEVVVEGAAVAQVETQSSDLTGTVNGKEISQLELNGRNFTQLVTLTPGVSNQTGQDEGTVGVYGNVSYSMNGGRVEYNNWELDGGDNMDNGSNSTLNVYPSIDAIAEFKVLTSNYGAQYGRNGSGTVEVETKSGTKAFHGDAYEFLRNDAFNSPAWFQSGVVPEYKKNDYGYTIGGPVILPGYNKNRDKTFFFWSEEWRKDIVPGQNFNLPVPSMAERAGDFTDLCSQPTAVAGLGDCPSVGADITGQAGYAASQPVAQALLGLIPEPNGPGASNCVPGATILDPLSSTGTDPNPNPCTFNSSPAQTTTWREELIRGDHNFNDKIRATFRYIHDSWQTQTAVPLWTNQGSFPTIGTAFKGPGTSLIARLTASASPTLLNEFVFSYTVDHIVLNDTGNWQRPAGFSSNFTDLFPGNGAGVIPGINLVDPAGIYQNFGEDPGYIPNGIYNSNPTYTYRDNITKIVGKHNLQMGIYMAFAQKNEYGGELGAGSFPGYLTFDPNNDKNTTGNPFADLLLGNIYSFGQQDHLVKYFNRYKLFEPYFQDDWRITNRLTLNLGLRVSGYETYREKQKSAFNFDPAHYVAGQTTVNQDDTVNFLTVDGQTATVSNLPNGIVQCGVTPGVPVSCMKGHWFNPAPRIGFAWDPFGDAKWALRGGYGVFFEHTNGNEANTESLENSPPLANVVSQTQIPGYLSIGAGPLGSQFPLSVNSIPDKVAWPYMQQWHLDLQHDIGRGTVATVSYVGSKGTHLTRQSDMNQLHGVPLSDNPYKAGETITPNPNGNSPDCGTKFDGTYGVPINAMTPSGVPIPVTFDSNGFPSGPAVNLGISACGTLADPLRPFPGYGSITKLELEASSIYHAFQASVRRSVGQLTLSAAYTFSHSIDDSSDRGDGTLVDAYNFPANRASSNFDQRHIFNFSWVWDVPFFRGKGITHTMLGGWQYSGIMGYSTGTPFSVLYSTDNAGVAAGVGSGSRADLVGDPYSGFTKANGPDLGPLWYNPAAFAAPQGLTFGNVGRNSLRNPSRTNFDMALFKHFPIHESVAFEFRAEAFNVFNHTEWNGFASTTQTDTTFLYQNAVHNARILQLGAKIMF
jgi:hypothetical protein